MTEKITFKMAYSDDKEKFIKHWSKIMNMDPKRFEELFVINDSDLFDDNELPWIKR